MRHSNKITRAVQELLAYRSRRYGTRFIGTADIHKHLIRKGSPAQLADVQRSVVDLAGDRIGPFVVGHRRGGDVVVLVRYREESA